MYISVETIDNKWHSYVGMGGTEIDRAEETEKKLQRDEEKPRLTTPNGRNRGYE
jgi:hypothetical protein